MSPSKTPPTHRRRSSRRTSLIALLLLAITPPHAHAVRPALWITDTEADFSAGKQDGTVVTDLGDIKLGLASTTVVELPETATIIFDMASGHDGQLFVATGPESTVWRLPPGAEEPIEVFTSADEQVFALATVDQITLLAISGDGTTRLDRLVGDTVETICTLPDTRYIWDMVVADGHAYLATGNEGRLYRVNLAGQGDTAVTELFNAAQSNLLCLGRDAAGVLYLGTDDDGLVYRVQIGADDVVRTFVLYDAKEPEIGALHVTADGTVYAGSADAKQAKPGRLTAPSKHRGGRPAPTHSESTPPAAAPTPSGSNAPTAPDAPSPPAEASPGDPEPVPPAPTDAGKDEGQAQTRPSDLSADTLSDWDDRLVLMALAEKRGATSAQFDTLRKAIAKRLATAREGDEMASLEPTQSDAPIATGAPPTPQRSSAEATVKTTKPSKKGNAVYRIGSDGMVEELMRESVTIYRLTVHAGRLIVGTGNEGQIYQINLEDLARSLLVDLKTQQVTALDGDGDDLVVGTASPARLLRMSGRYAEQGTYLSKVHDTGQVNLWGRLHLAADTPDATGIKAELRSGNVQDPDQAAWSGWQAAQVLDPAPANSPLVPREMAVEVPPARFIQYRLVLDGNGHATPVIHRIQLAHVTANVRPRITEIKTSYGSAAAAKSRTAPAGSGAEPKHVADLRIEWKATDPNKDRLLFDLSFQPDGSPRWVPIVEAVTATRKIWNTKLVPDGRYLLRVTASDRPDNTAGMDLRASRMADPVTVDNTPPLLEGLETTLAGTQVNLAGGVVDALSAVASIQYMVNGEAPWLPALPKDLIFDSTREAFAVTIDLSGAGSHVITLKMADTRANVRFHQVLLDVE